MNIFYLHHDVETCAEMHLDRHVVKMCLETAQLLSTAHRVLDGYEIIRFSKMGRRQKAWKLDDQRDGILYQATHMNHPSAVWCRHSKENYMWLSDMLNALCKEYTHRYGKIHKVESSGLAKMLSIPPSVFPFTGFTEPTPAMPDEYKVASSVQSYRNYYIGAKHTFAKWKNRPVPYWFVKQQEVTHVTIASSTDSNQQASS